MVASRRDIHQSSSHGKTASVSANEGGGEGGSGGGGYWLTARRPLQILIFLLPLILAYEVSLALILPTDQGSITTIEAHQDLLLFFEVFGIWAEGGLYLGGVVIVVVLLVWHMLAREPWRFDKTGIGLMAIESLMLTLPIIVIGGFLAGASTIDPAWSATSDSVAIQLADMSIWARVSISVGAGLYEELLFRMLLIAGIHTLVVDVAKASHFLGATLAVLISAALFTAYHPLGLLEGGIDVRRAIFFFLAGLYFGLIYILRGFGIVVAVHAFYDLFTVVILTDSTT